MTFVCPCVDGRVPGLADLFPALTPADRTVVIDLAAVSLLRSTELSLLVELQRHLQATERSLLLTHVGPDIRKVLHITRLDRLFTIRDEN